MWNQTYSFFQFFLFVFIATYFQLNIFSLEQKYGSFLHLTNILYFSLYCIADKTLRISIKTLFLSVNLPKISLLLAHRLTIPPQVGITAHCSLHPHRWASLSHIAACINTVDEALSQGTSVSIKMSAPKTIPKDAQVMFL